MTDIHHFYHVYSQGKWKLPLIDHLRALNQYELMNNLKSFHVGLVGSKKSRDEVKKFLNENKVKYKVCAEVHDGWEQETMDQIHKFAQKHDGYVYYAHTKNAVNINPLHIDWRLSMTYYTAVKWQDCKQALDEGYSAAGTHYLTSSGQINDLKNSGFFGGTFWWTHLKYIKNFPLPERNNRYDAEGWICNLKNVVESSGDTFEIKDFNQSHPAAHSGMVTTW